MSFLGLFSCIALSVYVNGIPQGLQEAVSSTGAWASRRRRAEWKGEGDGIQGAQAGIPHSWLGLG